MLPKIWFDIRNLQKISFPVRLIRFLPTRHLHGQKSARRQPIFMHFLSGFSAYSGQPVDRFRWNLVRSEIKWTQSRRKRLQVNIFSHFEDIQAQSRQKRPKIDQNLWMIQKFFEKIFFAQMFLNGPILKVIMLKVKFEDPQKIFPIMRSSWLES